MSFFVLSSTRCGKCGGGGGVQPKGFLQFTRPFTHNHDYYYKPHTALAASVGGHHRAVYRKMRYRT